MGATPTQDEKDEDDRLRAPRLSIGVIMVIDSLRASRARSSTNVTDAARHRSKLRPRGCRRRVGVRMAQRR